MIMAIHKALNEASEEKKPVIEAPSDPASENICISCE